MFTQAVNAGFVLIQLLYLMCQFLPNIKIKSYFCRIMQKPTPCKWSLSSNSLGLILGNWPHVPTHPLTQYFALKREVSVTVNFGSGEG